MAERSYPRRVGRYDILGPIARGGTATVYLATPRSPSADGPALVAVKLPHVPFAPASPASSTAELAEEAALTTHISHANVVRTLDVGVDEHGLFLVMEYVEGESLAALLPGGLPVPVARRILDDALAGLAAAHRACDDAGRPLGIVHRDFSPQNILVGLDGITRLTDFGIARAVTRAQLTAPDMVKGKAPYMSPEQAQGLVLDQRSDVWSAGVVAWELLAGRSLFPPDDPLAAMARIIAGDPPRVRSVHPDVPAAADEAIARALTTDRDVRCPDVATLRKALRGAWEPSQPMATPVDVGACVRRASGERIDSFRRETATAGRQRAIRTAARRIALIGAAATLVGAAFVARAIVQERRRATRPAGAALIATAQGFPRAIAVDSGTVYWSARDGVYKVAKDGKPWFFALAALEDPRGIALDQGHVYFAEILHRRVGRVAKAGGAVEVVADGVDAEAVVVADGTAYFASNETGAVFSAPASGGTQRTIAAAPAERGADKARIMGLVADAHHLYWTDTARRAVLRVPREGGAAELLAVTGPEPYNVAIDEDTVYWRDGTLEDGRVMSVRKRGGTPRALVASGQSFPRGIAVDASGVYWTAGDPKAGRVERARPDGTGRVTLADGQLGIHSIALDERFAYFTAWGGGSVWKVPKP